MRIGDLARRSGLTVHTIRYYERIGLLPPAGRDRSDRRAFDGAVLGWIAFVERLKTTGMPIREMLRYAALREAGPGTEAARRLLLEAHRERIRAHVADLEACLLVLDGKIAGYGPAEGSDDDDHRDKRIHGGEPDGTRPPRP